MIVMAGALNAIVHHEANFKWELYTEDNRAEREEPKPDDFFNPPPQARAAYLSPGFSYMRKKHLSCLNYCYFTFFSYHLPNLILINTTGLTITRLPKLSHLARLHRLVDDIS